MPRRCPSTQREDAELPELLEILDHADGIFLTGGNQLRLSTLIGGTSMAKALRRRNAEGAHIAGTSAGAAFLCEHMIAFGKEGASPRAKIVTLAPGLGLTNRVIIDQHFRQRDRLGRLLTALAYNPFAIGIGLDENTAAFIGPDDVLEVVGGGALTIVDPSGLEFSLDGAGPEERPGVPDRAQAPHPGSWGDVQPAHPGGRRGGGDRAAGVVSKSWTWPARKSRHEAMSLRLSSQLPVGRCA